MKKKTEWVVGKLFLQLTVKRKFNFEGNSARFLGALKFNFAN
jgi:hypothetical protein